MATLFPIEPVFPEGFSYMDGFLTENEENELLEKVSRVNLDTFIFQGFEAKRKTASFGYDYSFDKRQLTKGQPIPAEFQPLILKVSGHLDLRPEDIAELLVIEYPEGAIINWHRDAPPFDVIVGISLLSDCIFRLRPHEKALQNRRSIISFPVRRRSLYVMRGEARTAWQHSTLPVAATRYSITLRTLRESLG